MKIVGKIWQPPFNLSSINKKIDQTQWINSQMNDKFLAFATLWEVWERNLEKKKFGKVIKIDFWK